MCEKMKTKTEIKKAYVRRTKEGVISGYFSPSANGYLTALAWVLGLTKRERDEIIEDLIDKKRR